MKNVTFFGLGWTISFFKQVILLDKEKVKKLYLLGYTIKEISKIVAAKETTVKVCINRNFKAFRKEHFYANKARK